MIYEYLCGACRSSFDVIKRAADIDAVERCPTCHTPSERQFIPSVNAILRSKGLADNAEFNPGLGCVVKNKRHKKDILKAKGLEEVGNEPPEKLHKKFDREREERKEKVWAEVDRGWVGDGTS